MNWPNLITIARILVVPVSIWLVVSQQFLTAFIVFILAGISDAVDGFLAKRLEQTTTLGAYLDPLADKLMLVSMYISLGFLKVLPAWLVILVASRDVLIIGAIMLSWMMDRPVKVRPLMVSKVNTAGQILLAVAVLGLLAFGEPLPLLIDWAEFAVGGLTILSGGAYMRRWLQHMANGQPVA